MENSFIKFFLVGCLYSIALVIALQQEPDDNPYPDFKPVNIFVNITLMTEKFSYLANEVEVKKSVNLKKEDKCEKKYHSPLENKNV